MTMQLIEFSYLVSAICFIFALKGLSSPKSARIGSYIGMIGMAIALIATFNLPTFAQKTALIITIDYYYNKFITISIDKNEELYLFETMISKDTLIEKLKEITKENKDTRIFVKGDKSISYGIIVETMSRIQSAGFTKVALISDIKYK